MNLKIINNNKEIVDFITGSISRQLEAGKSVLLFLSGGSSIPIEVEVSHNIKKIPHSKLVVTQVDERYGSVHHSDSNWFKLAKEGFDLPEARLIPYLTGVHLSETTARIAKILKEEISKADYKIGIFGVGIDGHTAGILPHTEAVNSKGMVCAYETDLYSRITITPEVIASLDEGVVCAMSEDKWGVISSLSKDILIEDQPAQILKKIPLLTIFSNHKIK
jgi:6-phosphogluconolactonase/glucosamine-6-phosphate isomerase/deaminase